MPVSCCGGDWNEDPKRTFDRAVNTLKKLAKAAEDCGITLAVETVSAEKSRVITTLPELKNLLLATDSSNVKACLDLEAMGSAGENLQDWFEELGTDLCHIHFTDGRPCGHLIWGDGLHPLNDYIEILNRYHYEGYLGQKLTDNRYFFNPKEADRKNMSAFIPFFSRRKG